MRARDLVGSSSREVVEAADSRSVAAVDLVSVQCVVVDLLTRDVVGASYLNGGVEVPSKSVESDVGIRRVAYGDPAVAISLLGIVVLNDVVVDRRGARI